MAPPPREHPLARSPLVDRINGWLDSAWGKGTLSYPSLDPEELWRKAWRAVPKGSEMGGRSAEDAAEFRHRLNLLCTSLQEEADLNALGRTIAHGQLVRVLKQRLRLGALWAKRPELLETPIGAPILIVGQMRAGTTRVHRLLAADPALSATRFCDSWNPVPQMPDLRPLRCAAALAGARRINPWIDTIHPIGPGRADEELGWLASALNHCAYEAQWRIPGFTAFSERADAAPAYREFARILRTDAASRRNAARPRVMKVPQFAEDIPTLLAQFPDARVVVTHRAARDVVRSAVSLVANQMTIQSDTVGLEWIEEEWTRKIALREERAEAALAGFRGPLARVEFAEIGADWEGAIGRVYEALGLTLTDPARAAMRREMRRADTGHHHHHASDLRRFQSA